MELTDLDGVGPVTAKKLNDAGIFAVSQLIIHPIPQIAELIGSDQETARQYFVKARKEMQKESLMAKTMINAKDLHEAEKDKEFITTGTKALDKLFAGGIETGATTEIYGEFGSGKSQFCHTMAVRVQLPKDKGGLNGKCIWIDSEHTFRSNRIIDIATKLELDADQALDNITVARAHNSAEQQLILEEVEKMVTEDKTIKLIVVDSSTGLFRADYLGRGTLSERQQRIQQFMTLAGRIADFHKIAFILTNQVQKDPSMFFGGDPTKPIGGDVVAHNSTYRVYFKKAGKKRIAKMIDSPGHAETEVNFGLGSAGVMDIEEWEAEEKERKKTMKKSTKSTKEVDEEPEE